MFFIMGLTSGEKELDFHQNICCTVCGRFGNYRAYVTYMALSLFFIPIFKFSKKYYIKTTCCNSLYSISNELGKRIEKGVETEITASDLEAVNTVKTRKCGSCGYETDEDFSYCPKCGERM